MKDHVREFAVFGGMPSFSETRYVGRPNIGDRARFRERMEGVVDRLWFTHNGPLVREFEQRVAAAVGVEHCVLVTNATTGLEIVLRAAGLSGEVIMPSMTFVATAHSARVHGVRPVFCDVDPATGCIDPDEVDALITPRTTAIVGVHLWGQPCAVDRLQKIADSNGLVFYLDAAQAMGCTFEDTLLGGFGRAEVFSFHATKVVNSFEGGAITTNDGDFAERARALHNFGIGPGGVSGPGTNAKMTEAAAAMGLNSLQALDDSIRRNRDNHEAYRDQLAHVPGVELVSYDPAHRNNYQYVVIKVDRSSNGLHRDALLDLLRAENILAQRYFWPGCHQLPPYRDENPVVLPRTEELSEQVIALPTGCGVTSHDIAGIAGLVRKAAENGEEVTARWLAR